jgi:ABC-type sugar transport system permease subunit
MVRSTFLPALVLLVLIQSILVESFFWTRRRKNKCHYPKPTQGNSGLRFIFIIPNFHSVVLSGFCFGNILDQGELRPLSKKPSQI